MINKKDNPMGWDTLIDELDSAKMYINNLIKEMNSKSFEGEVYYKAQITNIYASINRAWNFRNMKDLDSGFADKFVSGTEFPKDIP